MNDGKPLRKIAVYTSFALKTSLIQLLNLPIIELLEICEDLRGLQNSE